MKAQSEKSRKGVAKKKKIRMHQPSQQTLAAILPNNGKMTEYNSEFIRAATPDTGAVWKGQRGLTSACGTMVMLPGTASYPRLCSAYSSPIIFCLLMYDPGRPGYSTDFHSHPSREHRQQILVVFTRCHLYWHTDYMSYAVVAAST